MSSLPKNVLPSFTRTYRWTVCFYHGRGCWHVCKVAFILKNGTPVLFAVLKQEGWCKSPSKHPFVTVTLDFTQSRIYPSSISEQWTWSWWHSWLRSWWFFTRLHHKVWNFTPVWFAFLFVCFCVFVVFFPVNFGKMVQKRLQDFMRLSDIRLKYFIYY